MYQAKNCFGNIEDPVKQPLEPKTHKALRAYIWSEVKYRPHRPAGWLLKKRKHSQTCRAGCKTCNYFGHL